LQIVAINDWATARSTPTYSSTTRSRHVRCRCPTDQESLTVNGDRIAVSAIRNPADLPWAAEIDVVFECTGLFTDRAKAAAHITAGARKVIISAPAKGADATVVYGVNHDILRQSHQIISNASCTTNCLAPVARCCTANWASKAADDHDSRLHQRPEPDRRLPHRPYRARSATQMIPSKTGAAEAVGLVLPELAGKLTGMAVRVPVINVSLVDLTVQPAARSHADEVNALLLEASQHSKILGYNTLPLVSSDFNHNPLSSIFDANHTKVSGKHAQGAGLVRQRMGLLQPHAG
jgi:glyceraldehyde 3-phosphate dehydrogenase